jgi:hypothetical protein
VDILLKSLTWLYHKGVCVCSSNNYNSYYTSSFLCVFNLIKTKLNRVGWDSSVGIAIRYGLDDPGIESWWERDFSVLVQTGPVAQPASYSLDTGYFWGVKRSGRRVDYPPPSSAEVKERVELYLYAPFLPSWPVLG